MCGCRRLHGRMSSSNGSKLPIYRGGFLPLTKGCGQPWQQPLPLPLPSSLLWCCVVVADDVATAADDAIMLQARASASVTRILTRLPPPPPPTLSLPLPAAAALATLPAVPSTNPTNPCCTHHYRDHSDHRRWSTVMNFHSCCCCCCFCYYCCCCWHPTWRQQQRRQPPSPNAPPQQRHRCPWSFHRYRRAFWNVHRQRFQRLHSHPAWSRTTAKKKKGKRVEETLKKYSK